MLHNNLPRSFATSAKDGLMSAEDKELLSKILPEQINENRADIEMYKSDIDANASNIATNKTNITNLSTAQTNHENNKSNPHKVTIEQLGFDQIDNTSDLNKPVSNATETRIKEVEELANTALQTALDKVSAIPFDTKAELDAWLAIPENVASLKVGTSFYIRETSTPDYWWDGETIQILETEKPDLTNYLTLTGNGSNTTVTFSEASSLAKITSGSKLSVLFGMVSKSISSLISLISKVGSTDISSYGSTVTAAIDSIGKSYLTLSGGTLTGALSGTSASFSGSVSADSFIGALIGNADTASTLATARTISLTGAVTGSVSFNGSKNVTIDTDVNHSHDYLPLSGGKLTGGLTGTTATFSGALSAASVTASGNITGNKVYNAVWNDYAEWFEKEDLNEDFEAGDIVSWRESGVTKSNSYADTMVVGIYSDSYGHIVGGESLENMEDNHKKFVPVGLAGRLNVKVTGKVKRGDLIISSDIPGVGMVADRSHVIPGTVIGKSLQDKDDYDIGKVKVLIMVS